MLAISSGEQLLSLGFQLRSRGRFGPAEITGGEVADGLLLHRRERGERFLAGR